MGGQIAEIVWAHHKYALKIRLQDSLLQSDLFSLAWKGASKSEHQEVLTWIKEVNVLELRAWLRKRDLTFRELRTLAQNNHVPNYSRLDKTELTAALEEKDVL